MRLCFRSFWTFFVLLFHFFCSFKCFSAQSASILWWVLWNSLISQHKFCFPFSSIALNFIWNEIQVQFSTGYIYPESVLILLNFSEKSLSVSWFWLAHTLVWLSYLNFVLGMWWFCSENWRKFFRIYSLLLNFPRVCLYFHSLHQEFLCCLFFSDLFF